MRFEEIKQRLSTKTVGIAGCGGLGSNCAVALARVGIAKLIIADYDVIEESNLNRQYFFYDQIGKKKCFALKENILKINPKCQVEAHDIKLDEKSIIELYSNVDVLVEAFDKAEMKALILETVLRYMPQKPLFMGVGLAGWGKFSLIKEHNFDNVYIMGDMTNEASENLPPIAPRVGIVANMQANKVLELLLEKY
jgi:sulfur carrier protein ThiS adenylyltransferase